MPDSQLAASRDLVVSMAVADSPSPSRKIRTRGPSAADMAYAVKEASVEISPIVVMPPAADSARPRRIASSAVSAA